MTEFESYIFFSVIIFIAIILFVAGLFDINNTKD